MVILGNMVRPELIPVVLATAFAAMLCISLKAQTKDEQVEAAGKGRLVPAAVSPAPFSTETPNQRSALTIEFRPAGQMNVNDRNLAADAESSIAEHAGLNGFELEQGSWSYQQVMCPALPNHLFLKYTRNNGVGDLTVFTASIPRGAEGRVRIIPILRRGYSLFSPAPINALTISAFNHIRAEEPDLRSSGWLGNGLCYAALAGAHPQIALRDEEPAGLESVPALTATMEIPVKGGEIIRFADAAATPRPMEWTMTFTSKGKLINAKHFPAPSIKAKPVPQNSAALKGRPVPQAARN